MMDDSNRPLPSAISDERRLRPFADFTDLSHARVLLDEAIAAGERAHHDDIATQEHRETAYDCYD